MYRHALPSDAPPSSSMEDASAYEALKVKIAVERDFNCGHYKHKCLHRRIGVRMRARNCVRISDYERVLDTDPGEYDLLLDTLTINVSKFFRNADTWSVLEKHILPTLFEGRGRRRIWSAGAAAGEEAYSVSIALHEYAGRHGRMTDLPRFRILGTDIDRRSLETARRAEYPELALVETPAERRARWFSERSPFRLHDVARRGVSFEKRDLLSGAMEHDQSLILCRNVVIYFDREVQERLFRAFHDALRPGGFLVLGKVETLLGSIRSLFQPISNRDRVFRKPE